jgi:hypothetical protein
VLTPYDIAPFYAGDLFHQVKSTGFLESLGDNTTFRIPNSNIFLFVFSDGCSWFLFSKGTSSPVSLTLSRVLELADEEAQTYLVFHLDIFRNESDLDVSHYKLKNKRF